MKLKIFSGHTFQHFVTDVVQGFNDVLNDTGVNNIVSYVSSLPNELLAGTNAADLPTLLSDKTPIAAPVNQDLDNTPTMSQFLNAANTGYTIKGAPEGMSAFLVDGKQLAITNSADGMVAKVWQTNDNQVIISFAGTTGGDNIFTNTIAGVTGIASDFQIAAQGVSQAEKDALSFTHYVVDMAQKQGIDTNNIFVTGHSLGGIEASYVAQQTGLAGVAFEATGIPSVSNAVGNGSNFASVVTYGDPVGDYATDTSPSNPLITTMPAGQKGELPHYGKILMVGDKADGEKLHAAYDQLTDPNSNVIKDLDTLLKTVEGFVTYHFPGTQAADMGISLSPHSITADAIVTQHGSVIPVGNEHLSQILAPITNSDSSGMFANS